MHVGQPHDTSSRTGTKLTSSASAQTTKLPPLNLTELLQEQIWSGVAAPGTWLRQERIAAEYGVSRTPVREALRALGAIGMVEVVPHRGALVRGPTPRDIREAYDVRAELEGYAAFLAATWVRDDQVRRMEEAERMFAQAVDEDSAGRPADPLNILERPGWSRANDLFHDAILEAAGNLRLTETVRALHRSCPRNVAWATLNGSRHLLAENLEQHQTVLQAILARQPAAAREAMTSHIRRSGELVAIRYEQLLIDPQD
jgi:DNA-binding GntR family transcriptional regulator